MFLSRSYYVIFFVCFLFLFFHHTMLLLLYVCESQSNGITVSYFKHARNYGKLYRQCTYLTTSSSFSCTVHSCTHFHTPHTRTHARSQTYAINHKCTYAYTIAQHARIYIKDNSQNTALYPRLHIVIILINDSV